MLRLLQSLTCNVSFIQIGEWQLLGLLTFLDPPRHDTKVKIQPVAFPFHSAFPVLLLVLLLFSPSYSHDSDI